MKRQTQKKPSAKSQTTENKPKKFGRPPAFSSVQDLEERMQLYLENLTQWEKPTKAGLSFSLGITRETLNQYEKKEDYSDVLKYWYCFFENAWVQQLSRPNATGTIFYLKNTFGYVDKHENDLTSGGKAIQYVVPQEIAEKHSLVFIDKENEKDPSATA